MRHLLVAVGAAAAVAVIAAAQGTAQPQTTGPPRTITVRVMITDTGIQVGPKIANRGSIARFVLINTGKKPHGFALGVRKSGAGRQTGFTRVLKPNERAVIVLFLDYRGKVPYRGSLPGDSALAQMRGIFKII